MNDYNISNEKAVIDSISISQANGSLLVSNSKPKIASKCMLILLSYTPHKNVIIKAIQLYSSVMRNSKTAPV